MFIKQFYTSCLSEAAYYIESNGEVAVVDPLRDIDAYLQLAAERKATIKYIFETHLHADFVSGHIDLSTATNSPIIYGPNAVTKYPIRIANDGEIFKLGKISITVLHSPGHTMESSCFLVKDENEKSHCIFTGDTLFVGDVGRPDLAQKSGEITMNDLAGMLYDSLQKNIVPLSDEVIVYPAHGPGSACGKNLGPETFSTIGTEKASNYALKAKSKEEFIKVVTEGIIAPPNYFAINASINKEGYESLDAVLAAGLQPLTVEQFKLKTTKDTIILDTRNATEFSKGFLPNAISIGLEGRFAEWAGSLLPYDKPLLLVTEFEKEKETVVRLARVGFSKIEGYLSGGFEAWKNANETMDMIIDVEPDELLMDMQFDEKLSVLDVRKPSEFEDGHLQKAINFPLNDFIESENFTTIDGNQNLYIHCAGGYRSIIAASFLKRKGINNLRNVLGGFCEIKEQPNVKIVKEKTVLS